MDGRGGMGRGCWSSHSSHHPPAVRGPVLLLRGCLQWLQLWPWLHGMMQHGVGESKWVEMPRSRTHR